MSASKLLGCCAIVFALAVGVVACGEDAPTAQTQTAATAAQRGSERNDPRWGKAEIPAALADVAERLEAAGYTPQATPSRDVAYIRVLMNEGGAAFVGIKPDALTDKEVAQTTKQSRGKLAAELAGENFFVANAGGKNVLDVKAALSDAQLSEFHEIVAAGSGQG